MFCLGPHRFAVHAAHDKDSWTTVWSEQAYHGDPSTVPDYGPSFSWPFVARDRSGRYCIAESPESNWANALIAGALIKLGSLGMDVSPTSGRDPI